MNIWGLLLKWAGWKVNITAPRRDKCVICVAPHTSNWDFLIGLLAYRSIGRKANFLMKEFWFFFPLGYILTSLGGIPVSRDNKGNNHKESLTDNIIRKFGQSSYLNLAVTPEGTRSAISGWRTGFVYIALGAGVPIQLGIIDYKKKEVIIDEEFVPSANISEDMQRVKSFYALYKNSARYPDKFITN